MEAFPAEVENGSDQICMTRFDRDENESVSESEQGDEKASKKFAGLPEPEEFSFEMAVEPRNNTKSLDISGSGLESEGSIDFTTNFNSKKR